MGLLSIENMGNSFSINVPSEPIFESDILFSNEKISDQYWRRTPMPKFTSNISRDEYWWKEIQKCWVTGEWFCNNGVLVWLPPNYYFFLRYWRINRAYPDFRVKRLKNQLFKQYVRQTPDLIGSYTIKNRRDGETISAMSDIIHEALPCEQGLFGIQSKTGDDAKEACWRQLMIGFKGLPRKFKVDSQGLPVWDGNTDPKKVLAFTKPSGYIKKDDYLVDEDSDMGDEDSETMVYWKTTVSNAFDGREMRKIVIDEFNKWEIDSAYDAYTTYIDCVLQGKNRVGLMDIFSSPSETSGRHNDEALVFWNLCDPKNIDPATGLVKSRVPRWFSNPLDGIEGYYDKYGFADADEVYASIMRRRAATTPDKLNKEIRKTPLNETEAFETFDNAAAWSSLKELQQRKIYIFGRQKKEDDVTPKYLQCKIKWMGGEVDTEPEIEIVSDEQVPTPNNYKDMKAPWLISENYFDSLPPLSRLSKPPKIIDSCLGIDNYDYRRPKSTTPSLGAGVIYKFNDFLFSGINKTIPMIYFDRPKKPNDFYEQMILGTIISQSMVQTENKNRNLIDYFEDRGYFDWLLPSDFSKNSNDKGNSPGGNTTFMHDTIGLLDALISYSGFRDSIWFDALLFDWIHFDPAMTHKNDLTMASLQAVFGAYKISMHKRRKKPMSKEWAETLSQFL